MANGEWGITNRRAAFTFVELLLAAMITALVATAGTTLVFAITNAATETRDIRATKTAGHYALSRIAQKIRSARGIGEVTTTTVTLWVEDLNADDVLNLNELAVIRYDGAAKQITYEHTRESTDTTEVDENDFTVIATVDALMDVPEKQTVVWCKGVETLTFEGHPANTDTQIVEVQFTIGSGGHEVAFQTAASPKASADYLFSGEANDPADGSTRKTRASTPAWEWP